MTTEIGKLASILSYRAQGRSKVLSSRRPRSRREHSVGIDSFKQVDVRRWPAKTVLIFRGLKLCLHSK